MAELADARASNTREAIRTSSNLVSRTNLMILDVYFTIDEKIKYLNDLGFKVVKRKVTMTWPEYHNDVGSEERLVWAVTKDGKDYFKPVAREFGTETWVDDAFQAQMSKKLKNFILSTN